MAYAWQPNQHFLFFKTWWAHLSYILCLLFPSLSPSLGESLLFPLSSLGEDGYAQRGCVAAALRRSVQGHRGARKGNVDARPRRNVDEEVEARRSGILRCGGEGGCGGATTTASALRDFATIFNLSIR